MLLTTKIKLLPNKDQYMSLFHTMAVFNQACNQISQIAFDNKVFSKFKIQTLCYYQIREESKLSAQLVIRAISKVAESYKVDKQVLHEFKSTGAIVYDQRILSFKGLNIASLSTIDGRLDIPMQISSYHQNLMQGKRIAGQADLILQDDTFYLLLVLEYPENSPIETQDYIGIDLGVTNLAVDSMGQFYSGAKVNNLRRRYLKIRKRLQTKGTKSAKKLLKKRRHKEQHMARDINHCIAKQIVAKALRHKSCIVLENLKGASKLRTKEKTVIKEQRRNLSNWSFYQLKDFISYKALLKGVPVIFVNPAYTSRTCFCCGYVSEDNRETQADFVCKSCGFVAHADYNAALNIRSRAIVN